MYLVEDRLLRQVQPHHHTIHHPLYRLNSNRGVRIQVILSALFPRILTICAATENDLGVKKATKKMKIPATVQVLSRDLNSVSLAEDVADPTPLKMIMTKWILGKHQNS
jgi:hypothetical protein